MIKKIFAGVLLAGVFTLLVLGAVNRTIAKSGSNEPLSLNRNLAENNGPVGHQGLNQTDIDDSGDCISENTFRQSETAGSNRGWTRDENVPASGKAEVDEWITLKGVVNSVSDDLWIIALSEGETLEIEGRLLRFIQENGFTAASGDDVILTGFMESNSFETGKLENVSTGSLIQVREETGRPLWAGGRRGGANP